jgi:trimeric autotransporter adhesin
MRRFLAFAVLLAFSLPIGLSITGCGHNPGNYCIKNGHTYGITTNEITSVILQPETTGVSLSWGQTYQAGPAEAYNCVGTAMSVGRWTYTSSNLQLADISPAGTICAGTWNRNSEGGVPNFTICTPPSGSSLSSFNGCTGTSCGIVQVTASGGGATSNPVDVYIHPPVTSVTIQSQNACVSQGKTLVDSSGKQLPLLAETTVLGPGGAVLCGPNPGQISCALPQANIGTITYSAQTPEIVTINNTTNPNNPNPVTGTGTTGPNPNGVATANLPGATIINATLSNSDVTSAAGYFSTCPPATIALSVNGSTSGTVTASSPQTVVASSVDIQGNPINGLTLNFASTEPQNLTAASTGLVTATFPSHATVTAVCDPPNCNPAPVNLVGFQGNGMPVAGNPVTINSPGRVSNQIWMASSQSPYFSEVDLSTGGTAAPVRLPYTPNSMVLDQAGNTLYFGSYHELMIYSAGNNSLSKEVTSVPGVVLGISPLGNLLVINDQLRQVIYLFNPQGATATSIAGIAQRAQFSSDGTTVYITGTDPATGQNTLFVYNIATGWSTYPLNNQPTYNCQLEAAGTAAVPAYNSAYDPFCGASLAVTIPNVATFLSGTSTAAHSYCPNASANPPYYPPAGDVPAPTDQLTATADGDHILGADPATFTDIWLYTTSTLSGTAGVPVNACPAYNSAPLTMNTAFNQQALPVSAKEIDQVVSSPYSNLAFVTYQGTSAGGVLPYYIPATTSTSPTFGALSTLHLSTGAQAPVAGIFAPDGSLFFVSTSGDNLIHEVNTTGTCTSGSGSASAPCDNGITIDPRLIDTNGNPVPAQFLAVKSRSTT